MFLNPGGGGKMSTIVLGIHAKPSFGILKCHEIPSSNVLAYRSNVLLLGDGILAAETLGKGTLTF